MGEPLRTYGQYELVRSLGGGGMGEVWLGRDHRLDRDVAVKIIRPDLIRAPRVRDRFLRETRIASSIVHPYVATVFDVVTEAEDTLLVMEYIEGERLSRVLADTALSLEERIRYGAEIAEALSAIHEKGIVHRDLKPGNVMITPAGHVKVVDFGLARPVTPLIADESSATRALGEEEMTLPGAIVGTVSFMSPEQLRGEELDERSDIFSLGVILYQLAGGRHPFEKPTIGGTASAILSEPPGGGVDPPTISSSQPLRRIVTRALEKNREDRYEGAAELAEDLHALLRGEPISAAGGRVSARRKRLAMVGVVALVVILSATAGVTALLRTPPAWGQPRIGIALVPFEDRTGEADGALRAGMVGDLLAADLGGSKIVRAVGPDQTAPLISGLSPAGDREAVVRRVTTGLSVSYVMSGTLYREGDRYLATMEIASAPGVGPMPSMRVDAPTAAGVAEKLASALRRSLPDVPALTAWRDDRSDVQELTSSSEEARLLYERGILASRDGRIGEAIEFLQKAVEADPSFAMAHGMLAGVLDEAGYGLRARQAASRAIELAPEPDSPATERLVLTLRAIQAGVFDRPADRVEASGRLAALFPDEPEMLAAHAGALAGAGNNQAALAEIDRGIALDGSRPGLHLRRAVVLANLERYDDAVESAERAEKLYALLDSPEGIAQVALARGGILKQKQDYGEARAQLETAESGFEKAGRDALAAQALVEEAKLDVLTGSAGLAGERFERMRETVERTGNRRLLCVLLSAQGAGEYTRGDFATAETHLREAVDQARQLQNDRLLIEPLSNLGSLLGYTSRREEQITVLEEALSIARSLGRTDYEVNALLLLSDVRFREGDVEAAIRAYLDVIDRATDPGQRMSAAWAHTGLAEIYDAQGNMGEALEQAGLGVDAFREIGVTGGAGYPLVRRGIVLAALGRPDEARRDIDEAERTASGPGAGLEDLQARCAIARAEAAGYAGRNGDFRRLAEKAVAQPGARTAPVSVMAGTQLCMAMAEAGPAAEAVRRCGEVVAARDGWASEVARARTALAQALLETGRAGDAHTEAVRAMEEAGRLESTLVQAKAAAVVCRAERAGGAGAKDLSCDESVRTGRAALERYIASAPKADAGAVREREDVKRIMSVFDGA